MKEQIIIKVSDSVAILAAIQKVSDMKFKALTAYNLMRLSEQVSPIVSRAEEIRKSLIINKYGQKSEETGDMTIEEDKIEAFKTEYFEVLNQEESIDFEKFHINDFNDQNLEVSFFHVMGKFIHEH